MDGWLEWRLTFTITVDSYNLLAVERGMRKRFERCETRAEFKC